MSQKEFHFQQRMSQILEGALRLPRSKRAFHRACLPIGVCQVEAAVQGWFRVEDVGAGHNCARGRVVDT